MIEPINKITCDWCGKFEFSTTTAIPKEFFLVTIKRAPAEKEFPGEGETPEVEQVLLCTACRNAILSARSLRMKERRENKHSQAATLNWPTVEPHYSVKEQVCA
ncbi:MAG: hypothetical protein C4520_20985 [Candidatus Abyssobacteria bacterium SURF_5]|uniref:Uncharacterized protein n=1 Tax=Abyssobacteria bacterium (strain SURF_5) TaxID=2093360 RepID=A0A3A4MY21_ABYX5|nr:MAG: hypothetical protein C4520_20985 [Candidatus Abyssubacteria bacterium SURF_5]